MVHWSVDQFFARPFSFASRSRHVAALTDIASPRALSCEASVNGDFPISGMVMVVVLAKTLPHCMFEYHLISCRVDKEISTNSSVSAEMKCTDPSHKATLKPTVCELLKWLIPCAGLMARIWLSPELP